MSELDLLREGGVVGGGGAGFPLWKKLSSPAEQLLINGIGKALIGSGLNPLTFEADEHMLLIAALMGATEDRLLDAAKLLCQWLDLKDENARMYVEAAIPQLAIWIGDNVRHGSPDNLFI